MDTDLLGLYKELNFTIPTSEKSVYFNNNYNICVFKVDGMEYSHINMGNGILLYFEYMKPCFRICQMMYENEVEQKYLHMHPEILQVNNSDYMVYFKHYINMVAERIYKKYDGLGKEIMINEIYSDIYETLRDFQIPVNAKVLNKLVFRSTYNYGNILGIERYAVYKCIDRPCFNIPYTGTSLIKGEGILSPRMYPADLTNEKVLEYNKIPYIIENGEVIPIGIVSFLKNNEHSLDEIKFDIVDSEEDLDEIYKQQQALKNIDRAIEIRYNEYHFFRDSVCKKEQIWK